MDKRIGKEFWTGSSALGVFEADFAEEQSVHQKLGRILNSVRPRRLLDYGCGDGVLLSNLDSNIEIGLYDINKEAVSLALKKSRTRAVKSYSSPDQIETESYDVVVFSLVLMCIGSYGEYKEILDCVHRSLVPGGHFVVTVTHPCFRGYDFASHRAEYTEGRPFNYMDELHEFPVVLHGKENEDFRFYDYHWRLSEMINMPLESGFSLDQMVEFPDVNCEGRSAVKRVPPFLMTMFSKNKKDEK